MIITIESEHAAEQKRAQCSKLHVEVRNYRNLIKERAYVTGWNKIGYFMLVMSCANNKGKYIGEELRKLKETTGKKY